MLIVTDAAAAAFRSAMEQRDLSGGAGIRLQPRERGEASSAPVVRLANVPTPGDAIVIDHGIRIFLDRRLLPLGDDVVIDVATDEQHQLGFVLRGPA
jgi:Fe-S cluster assembly iron-binding protein IscA